MGQWVFRGDEHRLPAFRASLDRFDPSAGPVTYLELGVARGTSIISADALARSRGLVLRIYAFDSFHNLPAEEGGFARGAMAYSEATFRRFTAKAGLDQRRVTSVPGMFADTLTGALREQLGLRSGRYSAHVDCDLYASTRDVLAWLGPMLAPGSVLSFDDWFAFDDAPRPELHGEQRAFAEWDDRPHWTVLHLEQQWNVAFLKLPT
jgi:O-methyltransferase